MTARPATLLPLLPLLLLLLLGACATSDVTSRMDPALPLLRAHGYRIAVMPFAVSAPADHFVTDALGPIGDVLALEVPGSGLPARERIGPLLRQQVIGWLAQGDFEVVEPWATDTSLLHHGLDAAAMQDRSQAAAVAGLLRVDGVLYGDVTRWNRTYYLVESRAEVGLRLELVDGNDGRSLFLTERIERHTAGLRGGPTGIASAASEPVAGLRGSHLRELARAATRGAALDLAGGDVGEVPAGLAAPRLSFLSVALPHEGPLQAGDRIDVVALGTPGCEVRFDLGALRCSVPMAEVPVPEDPRGGRAGYVGHYVVQPGDRASGLPVFATIRTEHQNRSSASRCRWAGTVGFGARP
ncbi:MAG TPA: hypothetical protein VF384_18425 [Planctomycetota bacterium]